MTAANNSSPPRPVSCKLFIQPCFFQDDFHTGELEHGLLALFTHFGMESLWLAALLEPALPIYPGLGGPAARYNWLAVSPLLGSFAISSSMPYCSLTNKRFQHCLYLISKGTNMRHPQQSVVTKDLNVFL